MSFFIFTSVVSNENSDKNARTASNGIWIVKNKWFKNNVIKYMKILLKQVKPKSNSRLQILKARGIETFNTCYDVGKLSYSLQKHLILMEKL